MNVIYLKGIGMSIYSMKSNSKQAETVDSKFVFLGETYEFVETFSGEVIESFNEQILVRNDSGEETKISDYGITFRNSHRIHKYELRQYSGYERCSVNYDALIVNENTGEYKVNLSRKLIVIPAFMTMLLNNVSMASHYKVMPVPKLFYILFTLLCLASFIAFCILLAGYKDGYIFNEHKYEWLTYLLSRSATFICIQWMKRKSSRFDNEIRNIIYKLVKNKTSS